MAVTYIQQQDDRCCMLACLSSLLNDKQTPLTQQQLIDKYPDQTNKGKFFDPLANTKPRDGAMAPHQLFHLLLAEGLACHFAVGTGKDFVKRHTKRVPDGIFLLTTTGQNGVGETYHCVRVENVTEPNAIYVMEPGIGYPHHFRPIGWNDPEFLKSVVVVCIT
jgi:hypothetical protein